MQDLKEYYRIIITLKNSGRRIEILTAEEPGGNQLRCEIIDIKGFIATPMIVEKRMVVGQKDVAAIEIMKVPHIVTWKNTELDPFINSTFRL